MSQITTREAKGIATKLDATPTAAGKKHQRVEVYVDDELARVFGFSHGKNNSNIQIINDLGISYTQAIRLARCQLSKDWYFDRVRQERKELETQQAGSERRT